MTLIDGDRIVTAQLYDDEHEEFTEKKMSIIDYVNAYTDEGVTEADVVDCTRWIPVSEKLPEKNVEVLATTEWGAVTISEMYSANDWFIHEGTTNADTDDIVAWMPLPEPYEPQESEDKLDGDSIDTDKAIEHYEGTLETLKGIDLEVDG